LHDRGLIKPGYKADLVLFNANQIIDRATFREPQLLSQGVERVFVNGVEVWSEGQTTGKRPGQALRRNN
jgi:N-acyl-D-amino-acid deacylase